MFSKIEKKDHVSSPKLRDNKQARSPRLRPVQSKQESKKDLQKKEKNTTPIVIKKEEYHLSLLKKNKKNLFDFKYECRKRDTLTKEIFEIINQYSFDDLGKGRNETIFIENKWNESKIWEWSNNKNLINYGILLKQITKKDSNLIECSICGCDSTENFQVGCGHLFCLDCWKDYLRNKLRESDSNTLIKTCCMKQGCQVRLISSDWELIFDGGKEYEERQKNLKISFLQSKKKKYSDCPNPQCDKLIIKSNLRSDNINVACSCGVQFCFSCHSSPHFPIACRDFTKWNEEVTQTVDKTFYPKCPECGILTEKTSGCEHISCVVCKKEWCYKCSSDWDVYHECNRGDSNKYLRSEMDQELISNQNNENIAKFFIQQYQENYANLIKGDIKHFKTKEMIEKVIFYRQMIKFSYVFSHFNKVSHFFEVRREFVVSMIDNFSKQLFLSKDSYFLTFDFTPIEKSAFYLFEIIEGK